MGQSRPRRAAHAKAVFLAPYPEPPREVVDVQDLRAIARIGQNDCLREVVIVGMARFSLYLADTVGPAAADFFLPPAFARKAEQVADRQANHDAAAPVLHFHQPLLSG